VGIADSVQELYGLQDLLEEGLHVVDGETVVFVQFYYVVEGFS
jgi:hypothetical protein